MNKIAPVLTGIGSPITKIMVPLLSVGVLVALVLFTGACSDDPAEPPFQTQPTPDPQDWLFTVYGTGPDDVYAAGARGAMFHYNGNAQNEWVYFESGTDKAITKIWDAGDGNLYATGHGGVILKHNTGDDFDKWSKMATGISNDLFGIGRLDNKIYACGLDGALLRLNGSTWNGAPGLTWILDDTNAPSDTLMLNEDMASLTTVNSFFIGGAYWDPNFTGTPTGMVGTRGGVLAISDHTIFPDPVEGSDAYRVLPDWVLRPLSGEQIVDAEWMLSSTSNPADLSGNYLGTSEGWLFQLSKTGTDTVWTKFYPSVTSKLGAGIEDIWLDADGNVYMVTNDGQIVYQTANYKFGQSGERPPALYDKTLSLTGIWGSSPRTFFVVGYMDEGLRRCTHDPATGYFNSVWIPVTFPAEKAKDSGPAVDKWGRPAF